MKAILFLLLWLPLAVGCKKNEIDALPPATQTGANTFGCLVNGKAWVPSGKGLFSDKPLEGGYFGKEFNLWIQATGKDGSGLDLWVRNAVRVDEYDLKYTTGIQPNVIFPKNYAYYYQSGTGYVTTPQYVGKITITRTDTVQGVLSGTFEFTCHNPKTGQTVSVTDGRFDLGAN